MKVALVFPKSTFLIDPMVYPPLGLWYLAAQLEALGHKTEFFDLSVDTLPEDGEFDQLWVSATSPQIHEARKIGQTVKGWQHTSTVLGGPGPWARDEAFAGLGYNLIVKGEADNPDAIRGVLQFAGDFHFPASLQLRSAPCIEHVLAPIRRWSHKYHATLEGRDGTLHNTTTMFTSRGCPMACAFCESGRNGVIWDHTVRYESIDLVRQQLEEIHQLGYTGIMFYDDILPLNKPRTLQILDEMARYNFTWRCFLRTDVIAKQGGYEYLKLMRDAGLVEVLAGVESADNRIKGNIHKGTTIEQDTEALLWCKQLGIKFKASLILGLPGETRESMETTRDWVLKYRPDRVDINTLIPFPGTPIVTHASEYDLQWTEELPETFWYKGPRDESVALVSTGELSARAIQDFRNELVHEVDLAGIPY